MSDNKYRSPAIDRAARILDFLADGGPATLTAVEAATDIPRSTLYALVDSMARARWVERSGSEIAIGVRIFQLGAKFDRARKLRPAFQKHAAELVGRLNETVQMAVLDGIEVLYIARQDSERPVRLVSDIGTRLPAHACGLGKALLAGLTDEELTALLPDTFAPVTDRTITSRDHLLAELDRVRAAEVAWDREEVASGLVCVAAPVRGSNGQTIAAVSCSVPLSRYRSDYTEEGLAAEAIKLAADITATLRVEEPS